MTTIESFLKDHKIEEVECLVPDMAGIGRGKILPAKRFIDGTRKNGLRIPEALFVQSVTGDYPRNDTVTDPATKDVYLVPDPDTIRLVPWYPDPTAQVICDAHFFDGDPVSIAARHILKRVLGLYGEKGWKPQVAPELEFFLVEAQHRCRTTRWNRPSAAPGAREIGRQAYQYRRGQRVRPPVRGGLRLL